MNTRALVLFAHGARDPGWAQPFLRLRDIAQAQLPDVTVALAFLDLMAPRLPALVEELDEQGHTEVTVVPVFLGQGGHVLRDLPALAEQLRRAHPEMTLKVAQAIGEDPQVLDAIATCCVESLGRQ